MFDIGFSELLVIGVVALVVIGPERLPKVARTAGHMLGRLQRYVANVKADLARKIELDELRKLRTEMQNTARDINETVSTQMRETEREMKELGEEAAANLREQTPEVASTPSLPSKATEAR